VKPLHCLLLIVIFSFVFVKQISGQNKVNISTGIGIPELFNVGLGYQIEQVQTGIVFGFMTSKDDRLSSVSVDGYYHFAGFSELSDRRPWYGRIGLNYLQDETKTFVDKYLYLNSRIGRDFNISNRIGIEIDAGIIIQLFNKKLRKEPSGGGWNIDFDFPLLPGFGFRVFYRI
jgi:hypothetical protein